MPTPMQISIRRRVLRLLSRHMQEHDVPFSTLCTTLCILAPFGQICELFPAMDLSIDEELVVRLCDTDDYQAIVDVLESAAGILLSDETFASLASRVIEGKGDLKVLSAVYELAFWRMSRTGKQIVPVKDEVVIKLVNSPSIDDRIVGHRLAVFSTLPITDRLSLIISCLQGKKQDKQLALFVLHICVINDEWISEAIADEKLSQIMSLLGQFASRKKGEMTPSQKNAFRILGILSSHLRKRDT